MKLKPNLRLLTIGACLTLFSSHLAADSVQTKDGSKLIGKILRIEDGMIELDTPYAGTLKIKQDAVTGFSTDAPLNVSFQGGNTLLGVVDHSGTNLKVTAPEGNFASTTDKVQTAWIPGTDSPETRRLKALERHWVYEVIGDLTGKSGNSNAFGTGIGANATLVTPQDKLKFYGAYDYQRENGVKSADDAKGGVDYTASFSKYWSWYVRAEAGRDDIKGLKLYNTDAAGIGRDFIKDDKQTLTGRLGLAYRYESYNAGANLSSPGLDAAIMHTYIIPLGKLATQIGYVPAFDDFQNYRILHTTALEMPVANSDRWKIRMGVADDYSSKPVMGLKRLDTTYFTHLVMTWR